MIQQNAQVFRGAGVSPVPMQEGPAFFLPSAHRIPSPRSKISTRRPNRSMSKEPVDEAHSINNEKAESET